MSEQISGKVWVLTDDTGRLINNIDTDMIFHNRYLHITEVAEMGQYALDNLAGYEDFAKRVQPGEIVVTGANFGCGSSRQQAVDCFRALGIAALVAKSFGAIYFRNAVNAGFPVLCCPDLEPAALSTGDTAGLDLTTGSWHNATRDTALPPLTPVSTVQRQIMQAGGLLKLKT